MDCCIQTLDASFEQLHHVEPDDILYNIFRASGVNEFEIILEQCGSLFRKRLRPYFPSNQQADGLPFKPAFRYAAQRGLITVEACERCLKHRYSRYGKAFADANEGTPS